VRASAEAVEYAKALERSDMAQQLTAGRLPVEWAITHLVYDDPRKGLGKADDATPLSTQLAQKLGDPQREIDLISPYFVPGKNGTQALAAFAERGIRLRILTNSLSATDVAAVHAGYARRREPLLRAGATIFELKPDPTDPPGTESPQGELSVFGGSSAASLHAKTFSVDRERVFVGSFNLDPRSVNLNTEMGVVIESAALANAVSSVLDTSSASYAYQVMLGASGRGLIWVERTADGEKHHDTEPATTALQRLGVAFLAILPIEWML
jgi:putative cardiolipin synthase